MDKRKEKYYNYVISDLVSKTEIEHEQGKISLPFTFSLSYDTFFYSFHPYYYSFSPSFYSPSLITFSSYLKERYGAQDEEIQIIWDLYKERIETIINNG